MNIFERATREKFRFQSVKGPITVENLWEMPLKSRDSFDLDTVAKAVNAELKSVTEESFVETRSNPAKGVLEIKLELVKHVIAVKQEENEARRSVAARKAEKDRLLEILERKQGEKLNELDESELLQRIAALS